MKYKNKLIKNLSNAKLILKPFIQNKAGIYKLVNLKNNKFYIGSSKNLYRRLNEYLNPIGLSKILTRGRSHIASALLKDGSSNFGIGILEFIELSGNLTEQEREKNYLIKKFNI